MDWLTITVTLIAALAPSVVSIITVRIQAQNNKENNDYQIQINNSNHEHELQLKQLEIYSSEKSIAISNYFDDLTCYLKSRSDEHFLKYKNSMIKACLYVSKPVYECINTIDVLIQRKDFDDVQNYIIDELLPTLNSEVPKYNKEN